jgi:RimJ/RimL family protein N-acetyltransferase
MKRNNYRVKVLRKIKDLKYAPFGEVTIACQFNNLNYKLILLTSECAHRKNLMGLLGKWRERNAIWFPSQFKATIKRTTKWFKERAIETPDRLLFMIKVRNEYIGHAGLFRFNFNKKMCEVDNIIRGKPKYPGIMNSAILHMMNWGRKNLGVLFYTARTGSDNKKALRLFKILGFVEFKRTPLIQIQAKDGLEWVEAPKGYNKRTKRNAVFMKLV